MKSISVISALAAIGSLTAVVGGCAEPPRGTNASPVPELAGRTAGAAERCVPIEQSSNLRIAQSGLILYGTGRTIWVNRLGDKCPGMDRMDILVVEPIGTEYCRGDRVRTIKPVSNIPGPICRLGDFVPYRR